MWPNNTPLCVYISASLAVHLLMDLRCFHILAIVTKAAVNRGVRVSFRVSVFVSLDKYLEIELLGHMVVLLLISGNTCILTYSACTNLPSPQQFLSSLSSTSSCTSANSHSMYRRYLTGYDFAFPWWLVMHRHLLCTFWPSVCLLWVNVYSVPWPFLNQIDLCVCVPYWVVIFFIFFNINPKSDVWSANIFSHNDFFHFSNGFFCCAEEILVG